MTPLLGLKVNAPVVSGIAVVTGCIVSGNVNVTVEPFLPVLVATVCVTTTSTSSPKTTPSISATP